MKVILTTNALQGSIEVIEAEFQLTSFMHVWTGKPGERVFYRKPNWHESRESAEARVHQLFEDSRIQAKRAYERRIEDIEQRRRKALRRIEEAKL